MNKKFLKLSFFASLALIVAGPVIAIGFHNDGLGKGAFIAGILIGMLITIPSLIFFAIKKVFYFLSGKESPSSSTEVVPVTDESNVAATAKKATPATWVFSRNSISRTNETGEITTGDISAFNDELNEKRGHLFFDKTIKIRFDLEDDISNAWNELTDSFNGLRSKEMDLRTGEQRYNTDGKKKSGGAGISISTEDISLARQLPKGIKSNIKGLEIKAKSCSFYFFPTFFAFDFGKQIKVLPIAELRTKTREVITVGKAPRDAKIVGQTWKYVNVSGQNKGQRDKRHKDNYKLDEYINEILELIADKFDLIIEFQFSKHGCTDSLIYSLEKLKILSMFENDEGEISWADAEMAEAS